MDEFAAVEPEIASFFHSTHSCFLSKPDVYIANNASQPLATGNATSSLELRY